MFKGRVVVLHVASRFKTVFALFPKGQIPSRKFLWLIAVTVPGLNPVKDFEHRAMCLGLRTVIVVFGLA